MLREVESNNQDWRKVITGVRRNAQLKKRDGWIACSHDRFQSEHQQGLKISVDCSTHELRSWVHSLKKTDKGFRKNEFLQMRLLHGKVKQAQFG